MPAGKEAYEKELGRKLSDAEYAKLSGAASSGGATSRDPGAYAGATKTEVIDRAGTKAPIDRNMATLKMPARDGTKYPIDGGLPALEKHNYFHPDDFNAEAGKSKSGAPMLEDGGTMMDWARAEMGGPGYQPPNFPAPKATVQVADGTGHNLNKPSDVDYLVQTGKMSAEEGEKLKAALKAELNPAAPKPVAPAVPVQTQPAPTMATGMQNQPENDYAAIIAANRKKWGL